jgi:hypothetical protein
MRKKGGSSEVLLPSGYEASGIGKSLHLLQEKGESASWLSPIVLSKD